MMSRVNKVIVGTNAVLANGGLLALSGVRMLAEAAKHYSVPFVVISGMYKLSPIYPSGKDFINDMSSPGNIVSFTDVDTIRSIPRSEEELADGYLEPGVDVLNPALDYIPPELVSIYLTNLSSSGAHNPSYIYRMLAEYYSLQDYTFSSKYDEDLIKVKNILELPETEIADALDWFLAQNQSFDVNQRIEDNTLLEIASEQNNVEVVKLLLERDDIAVDKVIALEIACEHENREVALFLLNHPKVDVEDSVREEYNDFITSLQ
uniref:Translation initiation factor eIF2B subunit beta n=1 Tax=Vannella robusta TaxID=1487602 RepID=A0A7S4HHV3_9EUKA|mmetsp:Transcript_10801/g.13323  ORF Transcript_10801/g.13323 Transcript_10801/m.13323 type:complete len:263 (+) Transcript_10801:773-1561(+)